MSKLTKSFEQEFPLPFHIEEDERGEKEPDAPLGHGSRFLRGMWDCVHCVSIRRWLRHIKENLQIRKNGLDRWTLHGSARVRANEEMGNAKPDKD